MEVFKLFGSIFVDTSEAENSISKTESKAGKLGEGLIKGIGTAAKWGTAIVGAATAAGAGMVSMASDVAGTTDSIDKMSQKIGISREAYQELEFICSQSGMSVNSLQAGMKTLTAAMAKAADGTAANVEMFEALGVSVTDANGDLRGQEDVMFEVMEALQGMENQTEKASLAAQLFGKSGSELMPLLNGEAGSIEAMKQQAHDLGLVLSDETIDAGVKLTDTMDQAKRALSAVGTNLKASVVPIVQKFADLLIANLPTIQGMVDRFSPMLERIADAILPVLFSVVETILPVLLDLFDQLLPVIAQLIEAALPVIIDLLVTILPPLVQIAQAVLPALVTVLDAVTPLLSLVAELVTPLIKLFADLLSGIVKLTADAVAPFIQIIAMLVTQQLKPLITVLGALVKAFSTSLQQMFGTASSVINKIIGVFRGIADFIAGAFTGNWKRAFQGLSDIVRNIFGGIVEIVKIPINGMISLINGFIGGLNKIKIPDWVPGVGGKGISIAEIPKLYTGGIVGSGTLISTNEREPEIIGNYGNKTLVMNNAQIIDTMVSAISETMKQFIAEIMAVVGRNAGSDGDIIIPVYIGQERIDEIIVNARERMMRRSGGRSNA